MIKPAKHNGVNFSYDATRFSPLYDFDSQRRKNYLKKATFGSLVFLTSDDEYNELEIIRCDNETKKILTPAHIHSDGAGGYIVYYSFTSTDFVNDTDVYFVAKSGADGENYYSIYSEICSVKTDSFFETNDICTILSSNSDNRNGFLDRGAFGLFKFSQFGSDIFLHDTIEYQYSYLRKKVLRSENQIAKRFTFHDLTMYQQNLLKWLCYCENLSINGKAYELISDFVEVEKENNSEVMSLQADFVEVNQSFFNESSTMLPANIFTKNFFTK